VHRARVGSPRATRTHTGNGQIARAKFRTPPSLGAGGGRQSSRFFQFDQDTTFMGRNLFGSWSPISLLPGSARLDSLSYVTLIARVAQKEIDKDKLGPVTRSSGLAVVSAPVELRDSLAGRMLKKLIPYSPDCITTRAPEVGVMEAAGRARSPRPNQLVPASQRANAPVLMKRVEWHDMTRMSKSGNYCIRTGNYRPTAADRRRRPFPEAAPCGKRVGGTLFGYFLMFMSARARPLRNFVFISNTNPNEC
jgi:hypothetical protein